MKLGFSNLAVGLVGILALCVAVGTGYLQRKAPSPADGRRIGGAPVSERQQLERRRANIGVVAVAGTTGQ